MSISLPDHSIVLSFAKSYCIRNSVCSQVMMSIAQMIELGAEIHPVISKNVIYVRLSTGYSGSTKMRKRGDNNGY